MADKRSNNGMQNMESTSMASMTNRFAYFSVIATTLFLGVGCKTPDSSSLTARYPAKLSYSCEMESDSQYMTIELTESDGRKTKQTLIFGSKSYVPSNPKSSLYSRCVSAADELNNSADSNTVSGERYVGFAYIDKDANNRYVTMLSYARVTSSGFFGDVVTEKRISIVECLDFMRKEKFISSPRAF
jgi:hypothetical protein